MLVCIAGVVMGLGEGEEGDEGGWSSGGEGYWGMRANLG